MQAARKFRGAGRRCIEHWRPGESAESKMGLLLPTSMSGRVLPTPRYHIEDHLDQLSHRHIMLHRSRAIWMEEHGLPFTVGEAEGEERVGSSITGYLLFSG